MFCDHCKIANHIVQRSYKLHGYPPGCKFYKGKRVVEVAQFDPVPSHNATQS